MQNIPKERLNCRQILLPGHLSYKWYLFSFTLLLETTLYVRTPCKGRSTRVLHTHSLWTGETPQPQRDSRGQARAARKIILVLGPGVWTRANIQGKLMPTAPSFSPRHSQHLKCPLAQHAHNTCGEAPTSPSKTRGIVQQGIAAGSVSPTLSLTTSHPGRDVGCQLTPTGKPQGWRCAPSSSRSLHSPGAVLTAVLTAPGHAWQLPASQRSAFVSRCL